MTGYVRQSTADIDTDEIVKSAPLNAEFNAIQTAFNSSSGHTHDGTSSNGPKISLTGAVSGILPVANGGTNASTAAAARTSLFGVSTTVDNTVPRFDGTTGSLQTSGIVVSDTDAVSGIVGLTVTGGGSLTGTWTDLGTVTTVDINGGTVDGAIIGGTTPAAITGTTITATTFSGSGASLTSVPATALTGTIASARITGAYSGFTDITASGTVTAATFSGSGASLTSLPATSLTGTIANARISGSYTNFLNLTASGTVTASALTLSGSMTANNGTFAGTVTAGNITSTGTITAGNNIVITGAVYSDTNDGLLSLSGGAAENFGGDINIYGGTHATQPSEIQYDASEHTFRSNSATTWLTINSTITAAVGISGTTATFSGTVTGNLFSGSGASLTSIPQSAITSLTTDLAAKADDATTISAGNGMTGGGSLASNRTITLGTPTSIGNSTTNSVSTDSHTHELSFVAAEVHTAAGATETDLPLGTIVWAQADGETIPNRHGSNAVYNDGSNIGFSLAAAGGTLLSGTWRARGSDGTSVLMQRTA